MKARAAACAAARRLGWTSVARMLPETSIAMMIVCRCDGSVTTAAGRAMETIMVINASRKSNGGMCRRKRCRAPIASLTMLRLAYASAAFFFRRSSQRYPATSRGTAASNQRSSGHWKVMGRFQMRRQNSAAAQLAAPLAQIGEAQDGIDEIVFRRQFQRVHAGATKCSAQLLLAPLRRAGEAL